MSVFSMKPIYWISQYYITGMILAHRKSFPLWLLSTSSRPPRGFPDSIDVFVPLAKGELWPNQFMNTVKKRIIKIIRLSQDLWCLLLTYIHFTMFKGFYVAKRMDQFLYRPKFSHTSRWSTWLWTLTFFKAFLPDVSLDWYISLQEGISKKTSSRRSL